MNEPVDQAWEMRELVAAAITKRRFGVDYSYDVTWQPLQTPQGIAVIYTVMIMRRPPLLGEGPLFHLAQIPTPQPTAEQVDEVIADGIRQLAELFEQKKRPPQAPPAGPSMALANGRRG